MPEGAAKIFSLNQANELIPIVADATAEVVKLLDSIRLRYRVDFSDHGTPFPIPEPVLKDVEEALHRWSEEIIKLGAHPKGYFTVDFQSVDPEMLYCWNYGEDRISFTHKVWENFNHRRPLGDDLRLAIEYSKEVN